MALTKDSAALVKFSSESKSQSEMLIIKMEIFMQYIIQVDVLLSKALID